MRKRDDNMNILVVNPVNKPYTNKSILAEPIDVLQIATIIQEKYPNVRVIDMDGERLENNLNPYLEEENIVVFVYDYQLPLHTSLAIENIREVISSCKRKTKFIMIGKSSMYFYQKFLEMGIDVIIKGIVDKTIVPVIDSLISGVGMEDISNLIYKKEGNIHFTKSCEVGAKIGELPIPKREFVDITNYMDTRTMITSRGCIGRCSFCTSPTFFKRWDARSAEDVVAEIEMLIGEYDTKKIMFLDDNMTVSKRRVYEICDLIEKRKIKCLFGCLASIPTYDKKLFKRMYEIGFRWVHFGLESGSKRILKKMNKILDCDITKKIISEVKEMGYRVRTSFILDYPTTTIDDLLKTKNLILELQPHEVRLHYLAYRVGTKVYEESDKKEGSQYIHSNQTDSLGIDEKNVIEELLKNLEKSGYVIVRDEVDFNVYNDKDKNIKIVAFTPIKYGMCWYE